MAPLPTAVGAQEATILVGSSQQGVPGVRSQGTKLTQRGYLALCKKNPHISRRGSDRSEVTATKWARPTVVTLLGGQDWAAEVAPASEPTANISHFE